MRTLVVVERKDSIERDTVFDDVYLLKDPQLAQIQLDDLPQSDNVRFHLSLRKNREIDNNNLLSHLPLREWMGWMNRGLNIAISPINVSSMEDYKLQSENWLKKLLKNDTPNKSKLTFFKEWWSYHSNNDDDEIEYSNIFNWLNVTIPDNIKIDNIEALEVIGDEKNIRMYIYAQISKIPRLHNSEFAIVTVNEGIAHGIRGNDDEIVKTVFPFIAHQSVSETERFTATFLKDEPAFHPVVAFNITNFNEILPERYNSQCQLRIHSVIPKEYIVDVYELERSIFSDISISKCDLELPSYLFDIWGTEIDASIDTNIIGIANGTFNFPLHLRYAEPKPDGGIVELPSFDASIYWSCQLNDTDYINTIESSFYTDKGRFPLLDGNTWAEVTHYQREYLQGHINMPSSPPLSVPTANSNEASMVAWTTLLLVMGSFAGLVWQSVKKF